MRDEGRHDPPTSDEERQTARAGVTTLLHMRGLVSPRLFEVGQREDVRAGSSDNGADTSREFSKGGVAAFGAFYDRDGQLCLFGEFALPHAGMAPGGHRRRAASNYRRKEVH